MSRLPSKSFHWRFRVLEGVLGGTIGERFVDDRNDLKKRIAYHEAAHALLALYNSRPVRLIYFEVLKDDFFSGACISRTSENASMAALDLIADSKSSRVLSDHEKMPILMDCMLQLEGLAPSTERYFLLSEQAYRWARFRLEANLPSLVHLASCLYVAGVIEGEEFLRYRDATEGAFLTSKEADRHCLMNPSQLWERLAAMPGGPYKFQGPSKHVSFGGETSAH